MRPDPNVLLRTEPCAECGGMMLWTQNAWAHGNNRAAAHQFRNAQWIDPPDTDKSPQWGVHTTPADTHQSPKWGVHDTSPTARGGDNENHRCGSRFTIGA